jgi:hypothetical protein
MVGVTRPESHPAERRHLSLHTPPGSVFFDFALGLGLVALLFGAGALVTIRVGSWGPVIEVVLIFGLGGFVIGYRRPAAPIPCALAVVLATPVPSMFVGGPTAQSIDTGLGILFGLVTFFSASLGAGLGLALKWLRRRRPR